MDANSQSNNGNSNNGGSASGGDQGGSNSGDQNQNGGGNQQQQQQQGNQNQGNLPDLKSLSAEQLEAVFENPHLYEHSRFKDLTSKAQELKKLQDERKAEEEKKLTENNEFKTLAEQRAAELEKSNKQIENMRIDQALTNKLVPEGVVDLEAALKLVDRSKVKIDESGNITGVDEALADLKKGKTYLFGKGGNQSLGSASNNQNGAGGDQQMKFKRSQLRDPKFYQEHKEEIRKAAAAGLIENDIS